MVWVWLAVLLVFLIGLMQLYNFIIFCLAIVVLVTLVKIYLATSSFKKKVKDFINGQ
jgi:uncharacterized protein YhhL (DUF1145 family)